MYSNRRREGAQIGRSSPQGGRVEGRQRSGSRGGGRGGGSPRAERGLRRTRRRPLREPPVVRHCAQPQRTRRALAGGDVAVRQGRHPHRAGSERRRHAGDQVHRRRRRRRGRRLGARRRDRDAGGDRAGRQLQPGDGASLRRSRRDRGPPPRLRRRLRADAQHHAHAARRANVRGLRRGPLSRDADGARLDRRLPVGGRDGRP